METFTVMIGDRSCYNKCMVCISNMTPEVGITREFNYSKFIDAVRIAKRRGCKNVLITGKGEPLLFPNTLSRITERLHDERSFDRIELQTSGFPFNIDEFEEYATHGLDLVSLSIYHFNHKNRDIYRNNIRDVAEMIKDLRDIGLEVRLSCNMAMGYIDDPVDVSRLIDFCKVNDVMQLTLRELGAPNNIVDTKLARKTKGYVDTFRVRKINKIYEYLNDEGHLCYTMPHGALVYEVDGQNISITTCLDTEPNRHLIYLPSGILTTSWEYVAGNRIL